LCLELERSVDVNILKQRLVRGERLFGAWIETGSATVVEILGQQGFDYLLIDLEHGLGDLQDLVDMLRAATAVGAPSIVRVPWNDPVMLKRVLDAGASSIMVPSVENAAEAQAAVRACRYPPQGTRGYASPVVRASGYGAVPDYMSRANDNLLLILQIESAAAARQAGAIAAVEGVDVVFIGVNDMAGSIGRLEQLDHPDVRALVAEAEAALRGSGKWMGTVPSAGATWKELFEAGYHIVPVASDVPLLRDNARAIVREQDAFHGRTRPGKGGGPSYGS
jgi:4-hydroxy-2-oxoheptanedioate aldolase